MLLLWTNGRAEKCRLIFSSELLFLTGAYFYFHWCFALSTVINKVIKNNLPAWNDNDDFLQFEADLNSLVKEIWRVKICRNVSDTKAKFSI